jgi:signal peptidase II
MKRFTGLTFLLLSLGVAGCDHTTKVAAVSALAKGASKALIPQVLELTTTYNTDTGFGLLASLVPLEPRLLLLKIVATLGVLFVVVMAMLRWRKARLIERLAFALLVGGAIGNALDRWLWGHVVDFIHLRFWPVFNLADVALTVGVGLLLFGQLVRNQANTLPTAPG